MTLAVYMMVSTIGIFWLGTVFALAWSIAAGQWQDREAQALFILEIDD